MSLTGKKLSCSSGVCLLHELACIKWDDDFAPLTYYMLLFCVGSDVIRERASLSINGRLYSEFDVIEFH